MTDEPQRQYLDDVPTDVQDLLYAGRKIEAIKLARQRLDLDLREAKETVEAIAAKMRDAFPDALPARKAAGCGTAAMLVLGVALLGAAVALAVH